MNKYLVFSVLAATAMTAGAQSLKQDYIGWPDSQKLPNYVTMWNNGSLNLEDENFFISRVKPKARFTNTATQVNPDITAANDRRVCMWLPITTTDGKGNFNALPNSVFDSEVFSVWSYVDHWGNWTAPHGWVPGNFADVAHKNGVGVSGVASIPFGGITTAWAGALADQAALKSDDISKFLYYHGVDGLGYNSEFSGSSSAVQKIAVQHGEIIEFLESKGICTAENIWYDGTNYSGGCTFDQGLGSHNGPIFGANGKRRASLFFNYNWNSTSHMSSSVNYANNTVKVSPLYLYQGMNMQGGEPHSGESYPYLKDYNLSLGYWGAHNYNMFWLNRTGNGSAPAAAQFKYLNDTEQFFTNGAKNPAVDLEVYTKRNHYPSDDFFGMSAFCTAKSTLCWDLAAEPFITYFNIGNGAFYNWKGETINSNEWYNIGMQDFMPTWRYWWAPTLMGRHISDADVHMNAAISWDDAWMGGSALRITGTDAEAYLHLFKTEFQLVRNQVITVRYKLNSGSADKVTLVLTAKGAETEPMRESNFVILDADQKADNEDWIEKTFTVSGAAATALTKNPVALVALHFTNAKNLDLTIGEFSIQNGAAMATPATPEITLAKTLAYHMNGVDGKVIFNMPNNKAKDEPCYNSDVNVSFFRIWAREEGGEPTFIGTTTSWAALVYKAPVDVTGNKKVQFGVSAVAMDHKTESEIAWSELMTRPEYTIANEITINKTNIKPNEEFTVSYIDPIHPASNWAIYNDNDQKVTSSSSATTAYTDKLSEVGAYNLVIDEGTDNERVFSYYIQVSPEAVGATPEIYTLTLNGETVTENTDPVSLELIEGGTTDLVSVGYTGRKSDGIASQGMGLDQHFLGCNVGELGLEASQSFTVAFWVNYKSIPEKSWGLLDITNRGGSWPKSNWGYAWIRGGANGEIENYTLRGSADGGYFGPTSNAPGELHYYFGDDAKFTPGLWTHLAFTFEYQSANMFRSRLFINGKLQKATSARVKGGGDNEQHDLQDSQDTFVKKVNGIEATDWLSTAGLPYTGATIDGVVDDFLVWDGAMTAEEIATAMKGYTKGNLPSKVIAYWDFENEPEQSSRGLGFKSESGKFLYNFECIGTGNEGQGVQTPMKPVMGAGCPFLSGTAYPVATTPTWTSRKMKVTEANGNGEAGSAKVAFTKEGDYELKLTLSNSYGSDEATYPVFVVKGNEDGIADLDANDDVKVYTVADALFVELADGGDYIVAVYNVQGQLVASKQANVAPGAMMQVALNQSGVYLVQVHHAGQTARTFKVAKK